MLALIAPDGFCEGGTNDVLDLQAFTGGYRADLADLAPVDEIAKLAA